MQHVIAIFLIAVCVAQPPEDFPDDMPSPLLKMTPEQAKQLLEAPQSEPLTPEQQREAEEVYRHFMQNPDYLKTREILDEIGRAGGGDWAELQDDPDRLEIVLEARRLDDAGKTREAIELYEQAIAQDPHSPANAAIEFRIASIYDYILHENWIPDKYEAKRRYEEIVAKYDPQSSWVLRSRQFLAAIYSMERKYDKAREQFQAIADAKQLLDEHPEQFHEVDALWVELLGLTIEKRLTDLEQIEALRAEQVGLAAEKRLTDLQKERQYREMVPVRRAKREAGIEPSPPPGYVPPTQPTPPKQTMPVQFRFTVISRASKSRLPGADTAPASPVRQPARRNRFTVIGVLAVVAWVFAAAIVLAVRKRSLSIAGTTKGAT